jgi:hypothetical protein
MRGLMAGGPLPVVVGSDPVTVAPMRLQRGPSPCSATLRGTTVRRRFVLMSDMSF